MLPHLFWFYLLPSYQREWDVLALSLNIRAKPKGSTEYLSILCPMIGPVECATNSTQCASNAASRNP